jgi:glycosyltransferase involved in cell wall biosynthesis
MKLSILIPIYNGESFIGNCLDSLVNQDISKDEYEIIVMDDGSIDNSVKVLDEYIKKHNNIFLYKESNAGLFVTRNKLLKLAKGDYIYNLDADDYISHNSLGTLIAIAKKNNLDILGFNSFSTKKLNLFSSQSEEIFTNLEVISGIDFLSKSKSHKNTVWWYILKQDFMRKNEIKFEEGNPLGDGPFTLRTFILAKKIIFFPMDIHRYVKIPTSIMNNNDKAHLQKMINNYIDAIYRYNSLLVEVTKKNDPNLLGVIDNIKFWSDVNVYMMFYKFIKAKISILKIDKILNDFNEFNAYPLTCFIGDVYFSKKHKFIVYIFNHKYLFYILLYPLRLASWFKILKFP